MFRNIVYSFPYLYIYNKIIVKNIFLNVNTCEITTNIFVLFQFSLTHQLMKVIYYYRLFKCVNEYIKIDSNYVVNFIKNCSFAYIIYMYFIVFSEIKVSNHSFFHLKFYVSGEEIKINVITEHRVQLNFSIQR